MTPEISVVISVFNGADELGASIDSLLDQQGADFEIIVVNDGSTDATPVVAESYAARDSRVRVIHLRRVGLTRALGAGCAAARGAFIARQDCGDRSLPGRLARQRAAFESCSDLVLVTSGTRFLGPARETLYEIAPDTDELRRGLSAASASSIRGPSHHGATMFRRAAYEAVGGYRSAFAVAQDIDLWLRLFEAGACVAIPEIHYEATLSIGAISHARRAEQIATMEAITDAAQRRRVGMSDAATLAQWRDGEAARARNRPRADAAAFYYFLGCVLRERAPSRARDYLRLAAREAPWRPKTWLRLMQTSLARSRQDETRATPARKAP